MSHENKYHKISFCRVCKEKNLILVLDLGDQYLSGLFPATVDLDLYRGPLRLVKCDQSTGGCGLVQLEHTFDLPTMYGDQYGYRSGLNASMVKHLHEKSVAIQKIVKLSPGDIVIDIAGNDGTFLANFDDTLSLCSIDPTSKKFSKYYPKHVEYLPDFFTKENFNAKFPNAQATLVTSFSMFYDLEDPCYFANDVASILDQDNGIWVLEQSYMPEMVRANSFDTVCHEHLSYYGMTQIKFIMDSANLKIIDFEFNGINGGSVSVVVAHKLSKYEECTEKLGEILNLETKQGFDGLQPWIDFSKSIEECRQELFKLIQKCKEENLRICAVGASTKGNVTLQTWELGPNIIEVVADVNPEKDGHFTPGTWIPIKDEESVLGAGFDVHIVLPWHFREFFMSNPKFKGKKLLFPLPKPEIVVP